MCVIRRPSRNPGTHGHSGAVSERGYQNLAPADDPDTAFTTEAACILYVGQGGSLMSVGPLLPKSPGVIPPGCYQGRMPLQGGTILWDTGTNGNAGAVLCFQGDGNLVIYPAGELGERSRAVWSSGTFGNPGAILVFQGDGNLVICDAGGLGNPADALWSSETYGKPDACLVFAPSATWQCIPTALAPNPDGGHHPRGMSWRVPASPSGVYIMGVAGAFRTLQQSMIRRAVARALGHRSMSAATRAPAPISAIPSRAPR